MGKDELLKEIDSLGDAELCEIVEKSVEKLTVMGLKDLVDSLQEKFGVSGAVPMMAAGAFAGGAGSGAAEAADEEQTEFDVVLEMAGQQKIKVIKVIKEVTGLGLKEAKALVDAAPKAIKEKVSSEDANEIKGKLEEVGATVAIK
ncbi:MAG: 50S ribosomal protein L7/L12 [bacterium]|nr:50S ribosomal protein L7/L12 [bacterium]